MAKLLIYGTHGVDDPTRATMPFMAASAALDRGHEPIVVLSGDATVLFNDRIAQEIKGVGMPPLKDLIDKAVQNQVPLYS